MTGRWSRPDHLYERLGSEYLDQALHVVGKDAEAHLGSDVFQRFGEEGRTAHPSFERAEDMLDGLSAQAHGVR